MPKINLFICYAREDVSYLDAIKVYINERQFPKIQLWTDGLIEPGTDWSATIRQKIDQSDIILLLLSQYFLVSDYINNVELKRAMERHAAGKARVIPIFARKCNLEQYPEITRLQGLPEGMRFLSEMGSEADTHYAILQKKIQLIADDLALNKDLDAAIDQNSRKAAAAKEIVDLQNRNRIYLSVPAGEEGLKRRREFLYQVEGKIKYEHWPFEITPGLDELQDLDNAQIEKYINAEAENLLKDCLFTIHMVADPGELSEGVGKRQYDLACAQAQGGSFQRRIIWFLNAAVRSTVEERFLKELGTTSNYTGCEYEGLFEVIRSLEADRQRQLIILKKKFTSSRKVLMLYNFTTDHNSELRIRLKTAIEGLDGVSFRFSSPNENLQKEKEDLEICHGGLIFYGSADPQWYLMRQSLLLDAQYTRSKAVCVDEPGIEVKVSRDVLKREFITIRGASELENGIKDFMQGMNE